MVGYPRESNWQIKSNSLGSSHVYITHHAYQICEVCDVCISKYKLAREYVTAVLLTLYAHMLHGGGCEALWVRAANCDCGERQYQQAGGVASSPEAAAATTPASATTTVTFWMNSTAPCDRPTDWSAAGTHRHRSKYCKSRPGPGREWDGFTSADRAGGGGGSDAATSVSKGDWWVCSSWRRMQRTTGIR